MKFEKKISRILFQFRQFCRVKDDFKTWIIFSQNSQVRNPHIEKKYIGVVASLTGLSRYFWSKKIGSASENYSMWFSWNIQKCIKLTKSATMFLLDEKKKNRSLGMGWGSHRPTSQTHNKRTENLGRTFEEMAAKSFQHETRGQHLSCVVKPELRVFTPPLYMCPFCTRTKLMTRTPTPEAVMAQLHERKLIPT